MSNGSARYAVLRFLIATAVLAGTVGLAAAEGGSLATIRPILWIAAGALSVMAASALWSRRHGMSRLYEYGQFAFDIAVATALCGYTGGIHAGLVLLFFPAIGGAAFVLGMRGALVTAGLAVLGLGVLVFWIEGIPLPEQRLGLYTEAMFRAFAFLLMAVLTGQLAERAERTGRELQEARRATEILEREHEKVLMLVPAAVLTTDGDDRVQAQNPAAVALLGEVSGEPLGTVLPQAPALGSPTRAWEEERADGTRLLGSTALVPGGGRVVLLEDITELHRMRTAAARDERLVAMGKLAAGVAHEIRNPLASLSGALQLLSEDPDPELARIAIGEARRIHRLVDDFLAVVRVPSLVRSEIDLAWLVGEVVEAFNQDPRYRGRVQVALQARAVQVPVDPDRVRQVLLNLLLNAAQAMPSGGRIEVAVYPEGGGATVLVRDHGVGIPRELRSRVFEPFYSTRVDGLGVGLMVVDQIVRAHGGTVGLTSPPEGGTEFRVWFPGEVRLDA